MPHFYCEVQVNFSGHIEAETAEEAEQKAYSAWGETSAATLQYESVEDITVELDDDSWCEDCEEYECYSCNVNEEEEALV